MCWPAFADRTQERMAPGRAGWRICRRLIKCTAGWLGSLLSLVREVTSWVTLGVST